ncbi:MAG TPA: OmpA family protein [Candidatus Eisenbacteria bacterium]
MTARSLSRLGLALARVSLAGIVLGTGIPGALAAPPPTVEKVDPHAPCFRWPAVDLDHDGVFDRIDRCDNTPEGAVVDEWGCPLDSDHDGVFDGLDKCPDTPPGEFVDRNGCSRIQRSGSGAPVPRTGQAAEVTRPGPVQGTGAPAPAPAPPPAPTPPVSETERQLVEGGMVRLENVYFETNSANLLPESEATLNEVGAVLEKFVDLAVEVQGHTDTRGSSAHNMKLSQARAESVRNYLLAHFHLHDGNLLAKGYGETRPETKERNDEERLRNRRVVIKALNPDVLPKNVKVEPH